MRRSAPILIVLVAFLIYAGRDSLLRPLVNTPEDDVIEGAVEISSPLGAGAALALGIDGNPASIVPAPREATLADVQTSVIQRNSSLYVELRKVGVSPADIDQVSRASKKVYNLRRVQPGQRFNAYVSTAGSLDSLVLYIGRDQRLNVARHEDVWRARIEDIPYSVTYHVARGTIRSSVFTALREQGAETQLATALDQIFGWTIDFISDIRTGDSFTILYERRAYEDGSQYMGDVLSALVVNQGREHTAFLYKTDGQSASYYDADGKSLEKSLRRSPLKFTTVTSNFSRRRFHPVYKTYRPHYGVDYGAPRGTPVYATGTGVVLAATRYKGNGNYVKIRHNNSYQSYYLHLNGFAQGVRSGTRVQQGQLIGYVGSTGAATAPHVCYRIKKNEQWVNPKTLSLPSKDPVPAAEIARFDRARDEMLLRIQEAAHDGADVVVDGPAQTSGDVTRSVF